jgi:type VI secretion system FHA domain protein
MTMVLNIVRCPDAAVPETRRVREGEFSIGRGSECDWVLVDTERHLSKRHCVVAYRSGGWWLADLSTNGTFVNSDTTPLGRQAVHNLEDGDRLHLGAYEIEVRIEEDQPSTSLGRKMAGPVESPFDEDPFADPKPTGDPSFGEPVSEASRQSGARLPEDFDPLRSDSDDLPSRGPTHADHSPAIEDAFRAPRVANLLPEDWDDDEAPVAVPRSPSPSIPSAVTSPSTSPVEFEPSPVPSPLAPPAQGPAPALGGEFAAFLKGAGLAQTTVADPLAAMEQLGQAFRAAISGLRGTMMARAAVKSEFRISQTTIRARGNNPLKFSTNDDDALAALLGIGRRTEMLPETAIVEALRDIRLHELATASAMQAAARALLARLDPGPIRRDAERAGVNLLPAQAKARSWDAFESLYAKTTQALADNFDSVFGSAFARAYEQAWRETKGSEDDELSDN